MAKRIRQADGSYCYTENCRIHDRDFDSRVINIPDAIALDLELNELNKVYTNLLANPDSTAQEIREAENKWKYIQYCYDSTLEGQKALEAKIKNETVDSKKAELSKRLDSAKREWKIIEKIIKEEEKRKADYQEILTKVSEAPRNPYSEMLSQLLVKEGKIFKGENDFGGPSTDYEAIKHFNECGTLALLNVEENFTWSTFDSYNSEEHKGLAGQITCKCGKEVNRRIVDTNGDFSTTLGKIFSTFN